MCCASLTFNPSLVRLARGHDLAIPGDLHTFNPSLVRLALAGAAVIGTLALIFQSQLGSIGAGAPGGWMVAEVDLSIPAWFDWRTVWQPADGMPIRPFNPSLVRLAPLVGPTPTRRADAFNPSLVRLAPATS